MGVKLSKPKIRRRCTNKASCKRENPEGGPSTPSGKLSNNSKESNCTTECGKLCPCSNTDYFSEEKSRSPESIHNSSKMLTQRKSLSTAFAVERLQVDLPAEKNVDFQSSDSLTCNKSEWVFVIDENSNDQSHSERLSRLMTSIRHLVNTEIDHCDQDQKQQLRVRLSLTPEPKSRHKVDIEESITVEKHQRPCGSDDSNSYSRRDSSKSDQQANATSTSRKNHWKESVDRREHYRDIPGGEPEGSMAVTNPVTGSDAGCKKRRKSSASRSRSRDRPCHGGGGCCRRHARPCAPETRSRHHRYQSPFDQSFQEAMCLRLTELQRKSSRHAKRTRGEMVSSSEESESDDAEMAIGSDSDSEYSGDDDNCILTQEPEMQGSRLYEPLSSHKVELNVERRELTKRPDHRTQNGIHSSTTSVQHHYYDERGKCVRKETKHSENLSVAPLVKPWHKPDPSVQAGKRKTLKKKRSSGTGRSNHGYLRANAIVHGTVGSLPITPGAPPKTDLDRTTKSSVVVKRHRHEHIHHHYYHHCKPET